MTEKGAKQTFAVFREWLDRTGDYRIAADRAGVSERTGRRWRNTHPTDAKERMPLEGAPLQQLGEPTRFIGRKAALTELRKLLTEGARLVSVLGPAGIGKTRLVLRYAELHVDAYKGGCFFCDLAEAKTADSVAAAVARVMGIESDAIAQVGYALASRGPALLILDNFEQAVAHAPETVGEWAAQARKAHIAVTSRVQLRIAGEACIFLDALELPPEGDATSEAVDLFLDRARLSRGDLALTHEDALAIATIVRKLDGNPLAIELAAARLGVLSPKQLLKRLERRFDVLVGSARDASARQTSMRVALDGSWDLLFAAERSALAQASVFLGGFSLEAAEEIIDVDGGSLLETLERLRQSSLLFTYAAASGEVRFGLYETIHAYARERLREIDPDGKTLARHLLYFIDAGTEWINEADVSNETRMRASLEIENVLFAMKSAKGDARFRCAIIAGSLLRGRVVKEIEVYDDALASRSGVSDDLVVRVLCARGDAHRRHGKTKESLRDCEEALALAKEQKLHSREAAALLALGNALYAGGQSNEALATFEQSLVLSREQSDELLEAKALGRIAMAHRLWHEADPGIAAAEKALAIYRRLGNDRFIADTLGTLATLHQRKGEHGRARACYEEALPLVEGELDPNVTGPLMGNLGTLYNELGEIERAREMYEKSLTIFANAGTRRLEAVSLGNVAGVYFEMGQLEEARACLERVVRMLREVSDASHEAFFTGQLGAVLATAGYIDEGEALVVRAEEMSAATKHGAWLPSVALHRGFIELARARKLEQTGDVSGASMLLDSVRARIAAAPKHGVDDMRVAVRMLSRALETPAPAPDVKPVMGALTVSRDAASLWLPTTVKVSLEKRRPVRLLLLRLIEEHANHPGRALAVDDLVAAGWPGERVIREAGASRVYVALGTLRKLGLRDVILSREGGYLLDPAVKVVIVG